MPRRRTDRKDRRSSKGRRSATMNLVSLMDIFTILVFFLLVNSSEVETLPSAKSIQLPESITEQKPRETVVVTVTDQDILVQGSKVTSIKDVLSGTSSVIQPLQIALEEQMRRVVRADNGSDAPSREVTIMGDKEIPYRLLKKVMITCTKANYGNISLAVTQKSPDNTG